MDFTVLLGLSCFAFFATAYDVGNRVGRQNWFRQTNYHNANRQSRQVFAFPDGDSRSDQGFGQTLRNNRQFGNNRGFTWGANNNNNNNNNNNFNNNRRRFPTQNDIRPVVEDNDIFVFDQNDGGQSSVSSSSGRQQQNFPSTQRTPTSTVAIPGMGTTRSACEDACLTTPEYNPVCGDDGLTYFSKARLRCAQKCGKRVDVLHIGACPRF